MKNRWSEFLFNIGVRAFCGLVIGFLTGAVVNWRMNLHEASHGHMRWLAVWVLACTVTGAVVAALSVPHWQVPWYKGIRPPENDRTPCPQDTFKPVPPETYNRLTHPSPKHLHDFLTWLGDTTVAELALARGNRQATRTALVRFFQRGLRAEVLLAELKNILPSVVMRAGCTGSERSTVTAILKGLTLEDIGITLTEEGVQFNEDDSAV